MLNRDFRWLQSLQNHVVILSGDPWVQAGYGFREGVQALHWGNLELFPRGRKPQLASSMQCWGRMFSEQVHPRQHTRKSCGSHGDQARRVQACREGGGALELGVLEPGMLEPGAPEDAPEDAPEGLRKQ